MRRHWQYLKYVLRHKWYVFWACLEHGVPVWIALLHDWDKFLPDEWFPYARCFYKPDGTKQYDETPEFARAWMLHQHRNKHHWQWWLSEQHSGGVVSFSVKLPMGVLVWDRGNAQRVVERNSAGFIWLELRDIPDDIISCNTPMPDVYRREMLADWIGAGKALGKPNTWEWYAEHKNEMKLHPDTREWVERWMKTLEQSARTKRAFDAGFFG